MQPAPRCVHPILGVIEAPGKSAYPRFRCACAGDFAPHGWYDTVSGKSDHARAFFNGRGMIDHLSVQ
jgi:hypothetical protein